MRVIVASDKSEQLKEFYLAIIPKGDRQALWARQRFAWDSQLDLIDPGDLELTTEQLNGLTLMFECNDVQQTITAGIEAGGSVIAERRDTPLGSTALLQDPAGNNVLIVKPHTPTA